MLYVINVIFPLLSMIQICMKLMHFGYFFTFLFQMALQYQQYFLQPLLHYICDKQGEVRQAACYGVGVMAKHGGEGFSQACAGWLHYLHNIYN